MGGFSLASHHARSISLPAVRPSSQKSNNLIEKKLKSLVEIRHGFSILTNVYKDIDEFLGAPITQRAFRRHKHEKWIESWLDESVTYLDICSSMREAILLLKTSLVEVMSVLKRPTLHHTDLSCCVHQLRKVNKETNKLVVSTLKMIMNQKSSFSTTLVGGGEADEQLVEVVRVLRDASVASNSIFRSLLLCLQSKGKGWCFVSKVRTIRTKYVDKMENDKVDVVINYCLVVLQRLIKRYNIGGGGDHSEIIQNVHERLMGLERIMDGVEKEMESLFKSLIHTRVSFLNLISH